MKANKKNLFNALLTILVFTSCSDILDVAPEGRLSMEEIFADEEKVGAYLNTCYSYIQKKGCFYLNWSRGPVDWCDDAWDDDADYYPDEISARLYNGVASATNHPILTVAQSGGVTSDYWNKYWQAIHDCSSFIANIQNAQNLDVAKKDRWTAEAHILRAYYYSELLSWMGTGLPIEREPFGLLDDYSKLEKPSYYETVKFIIEDCDAALSSKELPWRITTNAEESRVTKAVAEAIKSKMILFAASTLYNDGQNYWQEAYEINKVSMENLKANGYELYHTVNFPQTYLANDANFAEYFSESAYSPEYQDKVYHAALYSEYFIIYPNQMYSNPIDKETIWQDIRHQEAVHLWAGVGPQIGIINGSSPTQELVDSYETIDGKTILDLATPYSDERHLQPNFNASNTMYNEQDPYKNRDPRFYASIYYNGSKRTALWQFDEIPQSYENYPGSGRRTRIITPYIGEPRMGIDYTNRTVTSTGYYIRKFLHPNTGSDNVIPGANWKHFRLAEVILNFAEAAAEYGKLDEATNAVNEIRSRVGMPNLPAGLPQDELILRVRNERRVELALEGNRYFDVRRWTKPDGDLSKTDKWITAAFITRISNGEYTYERDVVRPNERQCYTNKYLKVPIPQDEADRLKAITGKDWQNPGW